MPNDQLDGLLNRLVSGTGELTGAELEQLRSAIFGTPENDAPNGIADIAAELDAPEENDQGKDIPCEIKSAEDYVARVAAEDQPVPASLLRLVGAAPAIRTTGHFPDRASSLAGFRSKHVLPWGSAIAATVLAGVSGYFLHDFVVRNPAAPASAVLPSDIADVGRAPENSTVANTDAVPPQQPTPSGNIPVPTLAVTPPTPLTSHAVTQDDYPSDSVRLQEQGTVRVRYLVLINGSVGECQVEISSGYPGLDAAACAVVKRWQFKPAATADGSPVEWWLDAGVAFKLAGSPAPPAPPQTPAVADAQPGTTRTQGLQSKNDALVKAINEMDAAARAQNWTLALQKAKEADAIKEGKPAALNLPIHAMIVATAINAHNYAAALAELDKEIASGEGNKAQKLNQALGIAKLSKDKEKIDHYETELRWLSTGITPPVATTTHTVTADDYPPVSIRLEEQGKVAIKYLVKEDGTVGDCNVTTSSGKQRLDDAACAMAMRRWKFKPATQNGKPVAEYLTAEVVFQLK
ncbi:MAG TPA: energy transducer TonB [Micropepsaceae bacterium]|nr:energy transducer TonB [Micropepsaceae bacterium]